MLLSAICICVLMAVAYMSAVSWVIRKQYLDQSRSLLQKAQSVIEEEVSNRKNNMLSVSRQLATERKLGSTIWYLAQYADSKLDSDTLSSTYQQLARDTRKAGYVAKVSKIAIYNSSGSLVSFALFDGAQQQVGFVNSDALLKFKVATVKAGEEITTTNLHPSESVAQINPKLDGPLPSRDDVHFAVVDDVMAIESQVPIFDEAFDARSDKMQTKQLGLVVMVQPLDQSFVNRLARLTDTDINVFTTGSLSSGSLSAYQRPDSPNARCGASTLNEISIQNLGYYQQLMPLCTNGRPVGQLVGYIAALHSKERVSSNTWEMIRILWLIAIASLVFILPFAWYLATSISRPLTVLIRIFRGVAGGQKSGTITDELDSLGKYMVKQGELGELTQSFIAMNDSINQKISQINQINTSLEQTILERTAALAAREQESRTLIENSQDSIARYDDDCRRIYANSAFAKMAGRPQSELLGKRPSEFPGGANAQIYEEKLREVLASGCNTLFELRWPGKDGRELCSHIQLTAEFGANGAVATILAVGRDITDRIEFEARIWRQANFDELTNLPNRRMFQDRLLHDSKLSHRSGRPMALMLIDLDHFKEINDTLGHDKGDILLVDAARRISSCIRNSDTVARIGGDEFAIILPDIESMSSIERVAQEILRKLTEPFALGTNEGFISASIGITFYPNDADDLDVLLKNADQAMYVAKNAGRNRLDYFTQNLHEQAQQRLWLTNDLRVALASGQFRVHYQPIVELATGRIYKAEALIRWQHPVRGIINPVDFIELAEKTGLIVPIGDWVFKQAVAQSMLWRKKYDAAFQISVNKSPVQIRNSDAEFGTWPEQLQQQDIPGQCVAVEITEGIMLHAESKIEAKLLKFREAGIQVSVDDFGTGYSSLSYLKKFDIDFLKIDRSFVHNLGVDANDLALCEAIIVMAHKLGLRVIAEGVETAIQRDLLLAANCDFAQGYLYSMPVPAEEFELLLQRR